MKTPARVLVTGATGAVGPRVVEALCRAGYRLRTLSLEVPPPGAWPEGVTDVRVGDITDAAAVRAAVEDVDLVVHLAALLHILNPPDALKDHYRNVNIGGTRNVAEAAMNANVKRLLFFSTIAVYGGTGGRIVDEDTPPLPDTFYARTKLEAEGIVLAAKNAPGEAMGTVLRLGAVYGSRIKGNYRQLLTALARGWFVPIGQGQNRRTLIYDKDVANAAVLALSHPAAAGRLFNVSDGQYHTMQDIIGTVCHALRRRPPAFSLPARPVRFMAGLLEQAARRVGVKPPIAPATIDKYTEDVAVDGRRIQSALGFAPVYDLAAGWEDTIREMRHEGRL